MISVPAVNQRRYYSVQLVDSNTFNFAYIGSRATGNDAGDYMVVGPDWQGVHAVRAFWSMTMYDGKTELLIKNPIDRDLINLPMLPQLNP